MHAVIIKKNMGMTAKQAREAADNIIGNPSRQFMRETSDSWRFRNIPKTKFEKFRSKPVNDAITIIFGKLKK